jgi:hypothetical protein
VSLACAKTCGLERLLDYRFSGLAKGVGSAKILGRIHLAQMKISRSYLPCTFTILDDIGRLDILFGLDMLRRHRVGFMMIDKYFFLMLILYKFSALLIWLHVFFVWVTMKPLFLQNNISPKARISMT